MKMSRAAAVETCTAVWHGTGWAYLKYQCRCPQARGDRRAQSFKNRGRSFGGHAMGGVGVLKHHDVDPVAVERACIGREVPRLGAAERRIVVAQLTAAGMSSAEIARQLGLAPRSVVRIRQRARELAP